MFSATLDNDEELKRLLAARESASLLAKAGASVDAQSAAQSGVNLAALDATKLPGIASLTTAEAQPVGGNVLGGLPSRVGASPGIVSPGDFDVMALLEESRGTPKAPQADLQATAAPQTPANQQLSAKQEETVQPKVAQSGLDPQMEAAMRSDATMRLARAIERGGRELVGGLTLTKPDIDNLATPEGTAEADLRALARQRMQAELDKQEAARKMLKERNESDRIGMWGKQIDASITNAGTRAKLSERELAQKQQDLAVSRNLQAGHYQDMAKAQQSSNALGWATLKQRKEESDKEFEVRKSQLGITGEKIDAKRNEGIPDGYEVAPGVNPSIKQKQDAADLLVQSQDLEGIGRRLIGLLDQKGTEVLVPGTLANTQSLQLVTDMKNALRMAQGLGVPTGPDMKILDDSAGSPTSARSIGLNQYRSIIENTLNTYRAKSSNRLKTFGIRPKTKTEATADSEFSSVRVTSPDGRSKMMPRDQAEQLVKKHGFTIQE